MHIPAPNPNLFASESIPTPSCLASISECASSTLGSELHRYQHRTQCPLVVCRAYEVLLISGK
jgi:hypothetical protein